MVDSDGKRYYLYYIQIGSLRYITDRNVNIVKSISYDSFGNITSQTNRNLDIVFGFAGEKCLCTCIAYARHDRDTNLVHFGFREYDPFTGRWKGIPIYFIMSMCWGNWLMGWILEQVKEWESRYNLFVY